MTDAHEQEEQHHQRGKRSSERQITKDDGYLSDEQVEEQGTIQRASAAELSKRKIVRVKRTAEAADGTSKNPFAGVSLGGAEQKDDTTNGAAVGKGGDTQRVEKGDKEATGTTERKEDKETTAKVVGGGTSGGGFGGLASSTGGFGGLASSTGGFGGLASSTGGLAFGAQKREGSETGTAVFGGDTKKHENNNDAGKVSITGEEEEKTVFSRDASLFELHEGTWKERGQGIVKVNTQEETRRARIIMRQKGNLKLILNANVWEKMEPKRMEGGTGVTFLCFNHLSVEDEKQGQQDTQPSEQPSAPSGELQPSLFAVRIKPPTDIQTFIDTIHAYKPNGRWSL